MSKTMTGVVTSSSSDKTITIMMNRRVAHPVYKKQYNVSKKFLVHDEKNEAQVGDVVEVSEISPVSKRKSWSLVKVVERPAKADEVAE